MQRRDALQRLGVGRGAVLQQAVGHLHLVLLGCYVQGGVAVLGSTGRAKNMDVNDRPPSSENITYNMQWRSGGGSRTSVGEGCGQHFSTGGLHSESGKMGHEAALIGLRFHEQFPFFPLFLILYFFSKGILNIHDYRENGGHLFCRTKYCILLYDDYDWMKAFCIIALFILIFWNKLGS